MAPAVRPAGNTRGRATDAAGAASAKAATAPPTITPTGAVGTDDPTTVEPRADGRHARRDRNKYAVVDAYLELVREGNPRPSIAEVADRSGVSHRSVFRYFADKDELARTAIERQIAVAAPLIPLTVGPGAPLSERIDRFVERRLELFEVVGASARLSRSLASLQPVLANELKTTRAFLRAQIRHLFRVELDAMGSVERAHAMAALDALCAFEAVDLMQLDQGLSTRDTAAAMRWAISKLLSP